MNTLEARIQNTEKALFALAAVLIDLQPPHAQDSISLILSDYFDANSSLGFNSENACFINSSDLAGDSNNSGQYRKGDI